MLIFSTKKNIIVKYKTMKFKFKLEFENDITLYFQNLQDLADELNIHYQTLRNKINKGEYFIETVNIDLNDIDYINNTTWELTLNGVIIVKPDE